MATDATRRRTPTPETSVQEALPPRIARRLRQHFSLLPEPELRDVATLRVDDLRRVLGHRHRDTRVVRNALTEAGLQSRSKRNESARNG